MDLTREYNPNPLFILIVQIKSSQYIQMKCINNMADKASCEFAQK